LPVSYESDTVLKITDLSKDYGPLRAVDHISFLLHRQVKTSRVVMPDLIRHPVFSMDVACAREDTGACALQGTRAPWGIRRNDGNSALLLPE
jgi:hypothetical protein